MLEEVCQLAAGGHGGVRTCDVRRARPGPRGARAARPPSRRLAQARTTGTGVRRRSTARPIVACKRHSPAPLELRRCACASGAVLLDARALPSARGCRLARRLQRLRRLACRERRCSATSPLPGSPRLEPCTSRGRRRRGPACDTPRPRNCGASGRLGEAAVDARVVEVVVAVHVPPDEPLARDEERVAPFALASRK